jgi:hypothetical protein
MPCANITDIQGAEFNITHFELALLLVWVVGGVADNGGWVPCGLGFSEQWNVGPCSSADFFFMGVFESSSLYSHPP